jgi:hypothetical protein
MAGTVRRTVFDDQTFLEALTALICRDQTGLRSCSQYLSADDFQPLEADPYGRSRWIVATRALEYYNKYRTPIGNLLRSDLIAYSRQISLGERISSELLEYADRILKAKLTGPEEITDKVVQYKSEIQRAHALEEMIDLQARGELTDERWLGITNSIVQNGASSAEAPIDFFSGLDTRISRRQFKEQYRRCPFFFIEPLDQMVRGIGPGNLGMILAPYKRGKSSMLLHLALAFTIQRFNTLVVTCEDPVQEVEDRLDAMISHLPIKHLADDSNLLRKRFDRVRRVTANRMRILDRRESGTTIAKIEQDILRLRDQGFLTHAVIVDYDEEVSPAKKYQERRFEFQEIYRDLRRLCARYEMLGWIASQTEAKTKNLRIISGDSTAEDKSKVRKVGMAIGMGRGDWGSNSIYLWVAAHKFDRQEIGCNIVSNMEKMLIYDRQRTEEARKQAAVAAQEDEG